MAGAAVLRGIASRCGAGVKVMFAERGDHSRHVHIALLGDLHGVIRATPFREVGFRFFQDILNDLCVRQRGARARSGRSYS